MIPIKYLQYIDRRFETDLHIAGVGVREKMAPGIVDRPNGTRDRLLMHFYDPVEIRVGEEIVHCPAGTIFLWPDQAGHYYGNSGSGFVHSWMHFHGSLAEKWIQDAGFPDHTPALLRNAEVMERRLYDIWRELNSPETSPAICGLLLELLFRELARELQNSDALPVPDKIRHAKIMLDNTPADHITLNRLARSCGLSVSHFSALFRKYYGISPLAYRNRQRLEYAAHLLANHNLRIAEIAEQAGYEDIYQFSRAFRKHFGISPSAMRLSKRIDL